MSISILKESQSHNIILLTSTILLILIVGETHGFEMRKLDETGSSDPSIKCGGCSPCGNPSCYSSPPPPSPPPPSLPPPPPPKKQPPSTPYCPPPPSPPSSTGGGQGFIYMTAPPGELYPVDHNYSGSPKVVETSIKTLFLGIGLMGFFLIF